MPPQGLVLPLLAVTSVCSFALCRHPTTFSFSPVLLPAGCAPKPSDWGDNVAVTGPLILTHGSGAQHAVAHLPQDLEDFLNAGVYLLSATTMSGVECLMLCYSVQAFWCPYRYDQWFLHDASLFGGVCTISADHYFSLACPPGHAALPGPPPIFVSFGSACNMNPRAIVRDICGAATSSRSRVLLQE